MTRRLFIFLVEKPFSKNDISKYGVDILSKNGFSVEVWDIGRLSMASYKKQENNSELKIKYFSTYSEFGLAIAELSLFDVILSLVGISVEQGWPYRKFRSYLFSGSAKIAAITNGHSPFHKWPTVCEKLSEIKHSQVNFWEKLRRFLGLLEYQLKVVIGGGITLLGRYKLDYLFSGVSTQGIDTLILGNRTKIFHVHNLDADLLLAVERKGLLCNPNKVVYLDSMGPLHPEVVAYNMPFSIEPKQFFASNFKCIDYLAKKMKLSCVIAAHPRSQSGQLDSYFPGYSVVHNQTADLVAQSVIVIAEPSLSLGMAVWFKKPIILLWHENLPFWNKQILRAFQEELGCAVWDVADEKTWVTPRVDPLSYDRYRENYLKKPGTTEKPFWEFVAEKLLRA